MLCRRNKINKTKMADDFTLKMLERARLRRERLRAGFYESEGKVSTEEASTETRKRKSPLKESDDNVILAGEPENKRLSSGKTTPAGKMDKEIEENQEHEDEPASTLSTVTKARLDKLGSLYSGEGTLSSPLPPSLSRRELIEETNDMDCEQDRSSLTTSRRNRLAALARNINDWEDDTEHGGWSCSSRKEAEQSVKVPASRFNGRQASSANKVPVQKEPLPCVIEPKKSTAAIVLESNKAVTSKSSPVKALASKTEDASLQVNTENSASKQERKDESLDSLLHGSKSESKLYGGVPGRTLKEKTTEKEPMSRAKVTQLASKFNDRTGEPAASASIGSYSISHDNAQTKKVVWDRAMLSTLESQGFTTTASKSRLEYKYPEKKATVNPSKLAAAPTSSNVAPPPPPPVPSFFTKSTSTKAIEKEASHPKAQGTVLIPKQSSVSNLVKSLEGRIPSPRKDPAEMTLAERKALFEKNPGNAPKPSDPFVGKPKAATVIADAPPKPPRVAAVPEASGYTHKTGASENPHKDICTSVTSNHTVTSRTAGQPKRDSPNKLGKNTVEAHRRLFENLQDNWMDKTIIMESSKERQHEMDIILNRFNVPASEREKLMTISEHHGEVVQSPERYTSTYSAPIPQVREPSAPPMSQAVREDYHSPRGLPPMSRAGSEDYCSPRKMPAINPSDDGLSPSNFSPAQYASPNKKQKTSPLKKLENWKVPEKPGRMYPCLSELSETERERMIPSETDTTPWSINVSSCEDALFTTMTSDSEEFNAVAPQSSTLISTEHYASTTSLEAHSEASSSDMATGMSFNTSDDGGHLVSDAIDEALDGLDSDEDNTVTPLRTYNKNEVEMRSRAGPGFQTPRADYMRPVQDYNLPDVIDDDGEEMPLFHSVSFYRKQKKEEQVTPVRVVQRVVVASPESESEIESPESVSAVKGRIQRLWDESQKQDTIIQQTSRALSLCRSAEEFNGSAEEVEVEKVLLISTQKKNTCLSEIDRLKTEGAMKKNRPNRSSKGSIVLSDFKMPIKENTLNRIKKENLVYHYIILVKCRGTLIPTQLVNTDDITDGYLHFPNMIQLHDLDAGFDVLVEVYCLHAKKEHLEHDVKYHIKKDKGSKKLTPMKSLVMKRTNTPQSHRRGSQFHLIDTAHVNLTTKHRKKWTLSNMERSSPLIGDLQIRVQCNAESQTKAKGFLNLFGEVSNLGSWQRLWFVLKENTLCYWKYPEDEDRKDALGFVDLRICVTQSVDIVSREICARQHTFQLTCERPAKKEERTNLVMERRGNRVIISYKLSADTREERIYWCDKLNQALTTIRAWDSGSKTFRDC